MRPLVIAACLALCAGCVDATDPPSGSGGSTDVDRPPTPAEPAAESPPETRTTCAGARLRLGLTAATGADVPRLRAATAHHAVDLMVGARPDPCLEINR